MPTPPQPMYVEVRVYKRYDTDLLALHDSGYSLSTMMRAALVSYANGAPLHFFIDEITDFDLNGKKNIRVRIQVNDKERNAIALLQSIKHSYRSNFCKMVLRNAIIQQNLTCYFADSSFVRMHEINASQINTRMVQNLVPASEYRTLIQNYTLLGQNVQVQHEKGLKIKAGGYQNVGGYVQPYAQPQYSQPPVHSYPTGYQNPQMNMPLFAMPQNTPNMQQPNNIYTAQQMPTIADARPAQAAAQMPKNIQHDKMPEMQPQVESYDKTQANNQKNENAETVVPGFAGDADLLSAFDAM